MSNENIENRFTESVTSFSIRNGLFKTDCKYLVALSGGADSVALCVQLYAVCGVSAILRK